jgi:hypothetical protein
MKEEEREKEFEAEADDLLVVTCIADHSQNQKMNSSVWGKLSNCPLTSPSARTRGPRPKKTISSPEASSLLDLVWLHMLQDRLQMLGSPRLKHSYPGNRVLMKKPLQLSISIHVLSPRIPCYRLIKHSHADSFIKPPPWLPHSSVWTLSQPKQQEILG